MRARGALALGVALVLGACTGPSGPGGAPGVADVGSSATDGEGAETALTDVEEEAAERELAQLLPLDPARVLWYRATTWLPPADGGPAVERVRDVGLVVAGPEGARALVSLGLGDPGEPGAGLRLWRDADALWIASPGAPDLALRAWAPTATWDEGRGRRVGLERVATPGAERPALRVECGREAEATLRLWLAPDVGPVRLEVVRRGAVVLRLLLGEVVSRARPAVADDQASPRALWQGVRAACRRVDGPALEALLEPDLLARVRGPAWDPPLATPADDPVAARSRGTVGAIVSLDARPRGPWAEGWALHLGSSRARRASWPGAGVLSAPRVDVRPYATASASYEATAPALVTAWVEGGPRTLRATLVLRRGPGGTWRWADVRGSANGG